MSQTLTAENRTVVFSDRNANPHPSVMEKAMKTTLIAGAATPASVITANQLITGVVFTVDASGGAGTLTLPGAQNTYDAMVAAGAAPVIGTTFVFYMQNLHANNCVLTAHADADETIVGTAAVSNAFATVIYRFTAVGASTATASVYLQN